MRHRGIHQAAGINHFFTNIFSAKTHGNCKVGKRIGGYSNLKTITNEKQQKRPNYTGNTAVRLYNPDRALINEINNRTRKTAKYRTKTRGGGGWNLAEAAEAEVEVERGKNCNNGEGY